MVHFARRICGSRRELNSHNAAEPRNYHRAAESRIGKVELAAGEAWQTLEAYEGGQITGLYGLAASTRGVSTHL